MADVVARIDDFGKPAWIAVMVAGFILFWPVGLGILAYMLWSGRMGCGWNRNGGVERWREHATEAWDRSANAGECMADAELGCARQAMALSTSIASRR